MIQISPIEAFADNYIWAIHSDNLSSVILVDPGDDEPVFNWLGQHNKKPEAILITHKHGDHVGGVRYLLNEYQIPVYGPANESIRVLTNTCTEGDRIDFDDLGVHFQVLDLPGHTEGHLGYYMTGQGTKALFCGDTLFAAGCGRVFSGTYEQLADSLNRIAALDPDTQLYCAHEYTLANLGFAKWVEPDNQAITDRIRKVIAKRNQDKPTVPSDVQTELDTNPFIRPHVTEVKKAAEHWVGKALETDTEIFTALRTWKDRDYD